ncbi:hypothetical protein ACFQZ4_31110 [Catellatospora coxensis]
MNATALADQAEAAARDARRKLASIGGDRPADIASDPWLAEQIGALLLALATDTARLCRHVKPSPMVLHATAWTPDASSASAAPRSCDRPPTSRTPPATGAANTPARSTPARWPSARSCSPSACAAAASTPAPSTGPR